MHCLNKLSRIDKHLPFPFPSSNIDYASHDQGQGIAIRLFVCKVIRGKKQCEAMPDANPNARADHREVCFSRSRHRSVALLTSIPYLYKVGNSLSMMRSWKFSTSLGGEGDRRTTRTITPAIPGVNATLVPPHARTCPGVAVNSRDECVLMT